MGDFLSITQWTEVVTHPLGLAGFALFLVFVLLARTKKRAERRWVVPVAIGMAVIALVGGLGLAYWQSREPKTADLPQTTPSAGQAAPQGGSSVQQETHGDASPAVADVEGDVTISISQTEEQEPSEGEKKKE